MPFRPGDLEWRVQQAGEKNGKVWALVLAYVTNRAIMARLDTVCGQHNWCNKFRTGPDGGVMCGLGIRIAGYSSGDGYGYNEGPSWVWKWDGGENTKVEAVKGGLSGAMKRAAVQWGVGRYLYALDNNFANVHAQGAHKGVAKDQDGKPIYFRFDPPALPKWALPQSAPVGDSEPD